jgi:ribosomal protein S18 acetylase RimI-like enzyme
MPIEIRPASLDEAAEITRVHIAAWRDAYRSILPEQHLAQLDEQALTLRRAQSLRSETICTFVARSKKHIVGYCVAGPNRASSPHVAGELQAIYLLPGSQGLGHGKRLTKAAAQWILERLGESMVAWTFEQNTPARGFYQHLGGVLSGYRLLSIEAAGAFPIVAYRWDDVRHLLAS